MPLSFDANNGYSPSTAIIQGRRFESLGIYHFEEPVMVDDYAGYAQVAQALDVPVSAGEHEYTRWQFRDLIERAQVDIIQPDIVKCGGISEIRKIAALGEAHHKHMVPHQTQPTIGTAANLHFIASLRDANRPQEFTGVSERLNGLFKEPLELEGRPHHRADRSRAWGSSWTRPPSSARPRRLSLRRLSRRRSGGRIGAPEGAYRVEEDGGGHRVGPHALPVQVQPARQPRRRHFEAHDQAPALGVLDDAPGQRRVGFEGDQEAVGAGLEVVAVVQAEHAPGVRRVVRQAHGADAHPVDPHDHVRGELAQLRLRVVAQLQVQGVPPVQAVLRRAGPGLEAQAQMPAAPRRGRSRPAGRWRSPPSRRPGAPNLLPRGPMRGSSQLEPMKSPGTKRSISPAGRSSAWTSRREA